MTRVIDHGGSNYRVPCFVSLLLPNPTQCLQPAALTWCNAHVTQRDTAVRIIPESSPSFFVIAKAISCRSWTSCNVDGTQNGYGSSNSNRAKHCRSYRFTPVEGSVLYWEYLKFKCVWCFLKLVFILEPSSFDRNHELTLPVGHVLLALAATTQNCWTSGHRLWRRRPLSALITLLLALHSYSCCRCRFWQYSTRGLHTLLLRFVVMTATYGFTLQRQHHWICRLPLHAIVSLSRSSDSDNCCRLDHPLTARRVPQNTYEQRMRWGQRMDRQSNPRPNDSRL